MLRDSLVPVKRVSVPSAYPIGQSLNDHRFFWSSRRECVYMHAFVIGFRLTFPRRETKYRYQP